MSNKNENEENPNTTDTGAMSQMSDIDRQRAITGALNEVLDNPGDNQQMSSVGPEPEAANEDGEGERPYSDEALARGDVSVDEVINERLGASGPEPLVEPQGDDGQTGNPNERVIEAVVNREPTQQDKMDEYLRETFGEMADERHAEEASGDGSGSPREQRLRDAQDFYNKLHGDGPRE